MKPIFLVAQAICVFTCVLLVSGSDDVNADFQSLQTLVQQQAAVISTMQAKLTALENKVDTLSKPVAFTARFSADDGDKGIALATHQTLVFDQVVTNAGNCYSPTTGIFTSPLPGYYAFSIVAMEPNAATHPHLALSIVKNGVVVDMAYVFNVAGDASEQGATHDVIHLAAGDQVWIRQEGGDGVRGYYWTVFTGFLVHAE